MRIKSIVMATFLLGLPAVLSAEETGIAPPTEDIVKKYYPSGEIMSEFAYWNGKLDGVSIDYYKNGQKMYEWSYRKNMLHGESSAYSIDGKLATFWNYKKGKLHGKTVEFHPNGKKKSVTAYKNGEKLWEKIYNRKGKLVKKENYQTFKEKRRKPSSDGQWKEP